MRTYRFPTPPLTLLILAAMITVLSGCDHNTSASAPQADAQDSANDPALDQQSQAASSNTKTTAESVATPSSSAEGNASARAIDWSQVASGTAVADRTTYEYPFAIDSQNVRDYADYFNVDAATAQYNLTVGMASNEALSKTLDQLGEAYTSHELTDGADMTLVIHTTPDIQASRYDYVLADDFAKGLTLPIVIVPDGKMSEVDRHGEIEK